MFRRAYCVFLVVSVLASWQLKAQTRDRIYIQTDRSGYSAGETVWFKTYLLSAFTPGSLSTNLYSDLLDENGKLIQKGRLPIIGGTSIGQLKLPLSLPQGIYFLRSYTGSKPTVNEPSYAYRTLYVFNPEHQIDRPEGQLYNYECTFKPEAGNLVAGLVNIVNVHVQDRSGHAGITQVSITNSNKEETVSFETDKSGNAKFAISPIVGEYYQASVTYADGTKKNFVLPKADERNVYISLLNASQAKICQVQIPQSLRTKDSFLLRGFMDDNIVFEKKFVSSIGQLAVRIPTLDLPAGMLQMQVTDSQKNKLGEANTMVFSDSSFVQVKMKVDSLDTRSGGKNVLTFQLPENIVGSFSVAITDAEKQLVADQNNIITGLLMNQDSKEHSFQSNNTLIGKNSLNELTLEMGSVEWRDQSIHAGESIRSIDTAFISINGRVIDNDNKKPISKGDLILMYKTKDSVTSFLQAPVGNDGSFQLNQLIFEGPQVFRFSLSGNKWKALHADIDTSEQAAELPIAYINKNADRTIFDAVTVLQKAKETITTLKADSISSTGLKEVVVKSRVIPPKQQVNDRYTHGTFSGMGMAKTLDLINEPTTDGGNVLDFLQGQIAGLMITIGAGGNYSISSNRQISLTLMPPPRLFLDETPTTIDFLVGIRAKDVALIKYYPPGNGGALPGVGIGAALVVYTKKYTDWDDHSLETVGSFKVKGYTETKDFTTELQNNSEGLYGKRGTIYWNPNLLLEETKPEIKVRFKNSSSAKRFHIVLEGYSIDGRLLHFEDTIGDNK